MEANTLLNFSLVALFVIGYGLVILEDKVHISKTASVLMMAIVCWSLILIEHGIPQSEQLTLLGEHVSLISAVIFFLLGALAIVEIINVHNGFFILARLIKVSSKRSMFWLIGMATFFLSAVLDNLTTTIVMLSITRKLISNREDRLLFGSAIVIAANAGGAWSPIGDVTTTMLWIGEQISTLTIIKSLFLPSFLCLCAALGWITLMLKGDLEIPHQEKVQQIAPQGTLIFVIGICCLILVPIFKVTVGLPPFLGMLFGLSLLWVITDLIHSAYDERTHLRVPHILTKIDLSATLFFLGILLAVSALDAAGLLSRFASWLTLAVPSERLVTLGIGIASSVIDNVPLVAAAMGMYDLSTYPQNAPFWQMLAYAAGTGGSILIIGSAAGIAFMAIEKVTFGWYLRKVSLPALVSFLLGFLLYTIIQ